MSQKQVMPKSEDLRRSLEINAIWTFDTEFPTFFNKSCTYITFKSAVKHRQLGYNDIVSRKNNSKSIPDHFIDGNEIITDKKTIANNFYSYFINIGPNMAHEITNTNDSNLSHFLQEKLDVNFEFSNVNEGEIIKIIDNLPSKSSNGKDQISTNLLKQIKQCIIPSLALIIIIEFIYICMLYKYISSS